MYSVKPGRGPSLVGGIAALVMGLPVTLFLLSTAIKEEAPGIIVVVLGLFLIMLLGGVGMSFYNAAARNRVSAYDITTREEESDPFDFLAPAARAPSSSPVAGSQTGTASFVCPSCGTKLESQFNFCPKCGKPKPTAEGA